MNVELLRKVQKHILEEPKRFDMSTFAEWVMGSKYAPTCGTTACIAGWAVFLGKNVTLSAETVRMTWTNALGFEDAARELLGINRLQAEKLFYSFEWPQPYRQRFDEARTFKGKAEAAADRIEHLIGTGQ